MEPAPAGPVGEPGRRLHPLTPVALGGRVLGILVVFIAFSGLDSSTGSSSGTSGGGVLPYVIFAAIFAMLIMARGFVAWLTTEYWVESGELRVDSGLLQRRSKRVRLDRLQSVDVLKPLSARVFGLAELRVTTAGTEKASVRLRFVNLGVAQGLRAELLGRSAGLGSGVAEAPEHPLVVVPHGTLIGSVLLQILSWRLVMIVGGSVLLIVESSAGTGRHQAAAGAAVAVLFSVLLILGHTIWRRVSTLWNFTVAESPDGLRIRHGLLSTSHQTVPAGRVQAIRIHQPALWRPFGWAAVEINVAGYAGNRESQNTMLLPVAPRSFAEWLVSRLLGTVVGSVPVMKPPTRARLRAPVWWRYESAGSDGRVFLTSHGVLSRTVEAVPHERTQSVRLTAGPWQRGLGLATVHLDSTRGPVKIRARFRDATEARAILDAQAERSRHARRHSAAPLAAPTPANATTANTGNPLGNGSGPVMPPPIGSLPSRFGPDSVGP
jgi:putative membrane protein